MSTQPDEVRARGGNVWVEVCGPGAEAADRGGLGSRREHAAGHRACGGQQRESLQFHVYYGALTSERVHVDV